MYRLVVDEITHVPIIQVSIAIDHLVVIIMFHLSEWFRYGHNCMLVENFPSYLHDKWEEMNPILKELNDIQHYKPQGRPPIFI